METLIKDGDFIEFLIEFEDGDFELSANFNVFEVCSWSADTNEVSETELYLKGYVKWDGCSHFWFGESDGYLHLCGKRYFEKHKEVMDKIWDICSKKIKKWDSSLCN